MKKYIISVISIFLYASVLFGQGLSNYDRRKMNDQLLDLLYSYERYSSFSDPNVQYAFVDLFAKPETTVYCDFLSSTKFGQQITANDYAKYATENLQNISIQIKNVQREQYTPSNGTYTVRITFDKHLEYEDMLQTYFSTDDKTIGDFKCTIVCEYNQSEKRFVIKSFTGIQNPASTFPKGSKFIVMQKTNDMDKSLVSNNRNVTYNDFDVAYLPAGAFPTMDDEDIIITSKVVEAERYKKITNTYEIKRARFRAGFSAAPISAYKVKSPVDFSECKSSAYEIYADIGYAFKFPKRVKLGIFTGLGLSFSNINLSVSDIQYKYLLTDELSQQYTRKYSLSNVSEGLSFVDVVIPFYLSVEGSVHSKIAVSCDAGIKLYLNTNTKVTPYNVDGSVDCIYSGKVNNTIQLPSQMDKYMIPVSYARSTYDVAFFTKVGCEFKVTKVDNIFLKLGYTYGFKESYNSTLADWYNPSTGVYPFVYSNKSNSDVAVRSFMDCISYRRSAFTIDLGYRFKF